MREGAWTLGAAFVVALFCAAMVAHDPGYFWHDDFQTYHIPGYHDILRALRQGEFPLVSPYSWFGGALAGEYQYGLFSVVQLPVLVVVMNLDLSMPASAALLATTYLAILAAGAFRLARVRGLSEDLAMLVALTASLNGWLLGWGALAWFPAVVSFAWVPWYWWALHRAEDRDGLGRFVMPGVFLYLMLAAGWPYTTLMCGLLTLWFGVRWLSRGGWQATWPLAASWVLGFALSAPAWMMIVEFKPATLRSHMEWLHWEWRVPLHSLPALLLPAVLTPWSVFGVWKLHANFELAGGTVPLIVVIATLRYAGRAFLREHRAEFWLTVAALSAAVSPSFGMFRWSFRWLPLFFLALSLTGAHALAHWRSGKEYSLGDEPAPSERTPNFGKWGAALVGLVTLFALALGWDETGRTAIQGGLVVGACLLWAAAEKYLPARHAARVWAPTLVALGTLGCHHLQLSQLLEVPTWAFDDSVRQPEPFDPDRCYLGVYHFFDMIQLDAFSASRFQTGIGRGLRPSNVPMSAGLRFVNGYSGLQPRGLSDVLHLHMQGCLSTEKGMDRILRQECGPDGLLALIGVDGLVVADKRATHAAELAALGWEHVAAVEGGHVYHRRGAPSPRVRSISRVEMESDYERIVARITRRTEARVPRLLVAPPESVTSSPLELATVRVQLTEERRNGLTLEVANASPEREALIALSRAWYPGYQATLNGAPLTVEALNLIQLAVRVPPGESGTLVVEYRPTSLVVGCWVAGGTWAGLLVVVLARCVRRKD